MPRHAIWGFDPKGEAKCYALYIDKEDIPEMIEKAKKEGWKGLVSGPITPTTPTEEPEKETP